MHNGEKMPGDARALLQEAGTSVARRTDRLIPLVLVACILLVIFWEVMANRSRRPLQPFALTAESFASFSPAAGGWTIRRVPVPDTLTEPNILGFSVKGSGISDSPAPREGALPFVQIRLVHGYNMCDCMRIKGYKVELLGERNATGKTEKGKKEDRGGRVQVWRLTSGAADVSIWVTSLLRAGDMSVTDEDVRSMPFPRVGIPDEPGWFPRGVTLKSLRHPVDNLNLFLRAKWNASRCNVATFLRLRTPAWASDEILTLVSSSAELSVISEQKKSSPVTGIAISGEEKAVAEQVISVHLLMASCLQTWRKEKGSGE